MADILLFPAQRAVAQPSDAPQTQAAAPAAAPDADAWSEDDVGDNGDLETVASLAAAPSQSLAALAAKMEMLVARLTPDDGTNTGLCLAEADLLRSALRDLQAFVRDAAFAAHGAELWAPALAGVNLMPGNSAGSCAGNSAVHYQV